MSDFELHQIETDRKPIIIGLNIIACCLALVIGFFSLKFGISQLLSWLGLAVALGLIAIHVWRSESLEDFNFFLISGIITLLITGLGLANYFLGFF